MGIIEAIILAKTFGVLVLILALSIEKPVSQPVRKKEYKIERVFNDEQRARIQAVINKNKGL